MPSLKLIDRAALAAIFLAAMSIPLASRAFAAAPDAAPVTVRLPDGGERRFYPSGPMGTTTFRIDVTSTGVIAERKQVLTDEIFRTIQPGMPASDVLARIGPPYAKIRFPSTRTTSWDYHYRDAWGYGAEFSVICGDDGIVVGRFSAREGD